MSNPARAPKEFSTLQLALAVSPDSYLPDGYQAFAKEHRKIEQAQALLMKLDMEVVGTIVIPRSLTLDSRVLASNDQSFALAKKGLPIPRVRTAMAKGLANKVFGDLPFTGFASQEIVANAMRSKVYVDGGAEGALGRLLKAYPRRGIRPAFPVSVDEARAAVVRSGAVLRHLPASYLTPFPLVAKDHEVAVKVNPKSENGFPVLEKWETPGAAEMAMRLAVTVREELLRTGDVVTWVREAESSRPWLVAVKGKAKADYYSQEKVVGGCMRFYNAFPRQIVMNMAVATQVLDMHSRSILDDPLTVRTAIGVSLAHGGAGDLVEALQLQLQHDKQAYVHVGDDSWVILKRGTRVCMFALDCSNFDLTQHGDVTKAIHDEIRAELRAVDKAAADLWYAYARERIVVVAGSLVRRWRHAGPSGMPLQSKVNDALMDVMITRTLQKLSGEDLSEATVATAVSSAGGGMGFVVRLEQYWLGDAESLFEALQQRPFLFIGYYFHVRGREVQVCCDVPRTLAQVPFPSLKWCKQQEELEVMEAMRLGSIALNLGMPTRELETAFETFRWEAATLVERAIQRAGDVEHPRLRWAVQENPVALAVDVAPTLSGLLRALARDPRQLWLTKEAELVSSSTLMAIAVETRVEPAPVLFSWASIVEDEEEEEAALQEARLTKRPPPDMSKRKLMLPPGARPTHPPTRTNDGRPPPTVVWAPDKVPMERVDPGRVGKRTRRRDGIAKREFHEFLLHDQIDVGSSDYESD